MINKILVFLLTISLPNVFLGQTLKKLSLIEAYQMLEQNYPNLQNKGLLEQIYQHELTQLEIAKKPTFFLKADGRIQSESTQLDSEGASLPFEINQPLFSVKPYVEAQYLILDGGINDAQKKLKEVQLQADLQNIEVERFSLRERINQLFIGTALLREQAKLIEISINDLAERKRILMAGVEMGTLMESELTKIEVRELELESQKSNLSFQKNGLINTLSLLTGQQISEKVLLEFPPLSSPLEIPKLNRPEQKLFQLQREAILANSDLIDIAKKPTLSAYAQAGVGYPNPLNILDNNIAPFGTLGLQFQWKLTDWKKQDVDRQILSLQAQKLQNAEATFDFNIKSQEGQYKSSVQRLLNQIQQDEKIATLQADILKQLAAQLDGGIITSTEYLTQSNAELKARQNLLIHQLELRQLQIEFFNERNGLK